MKKNFRNQALKYLPGQYTSLQTVVKARIGSLLLPEEEKHELFQRIALMDDVMIECYLDELEWKLEISEEVTQDGI